MDIQSLNHSITPTLQSIMPDFTITLLPKLYKALQSQGFSFISVSDILQNKEISSKYIILRHDVEKYYENALEFARIQNELGIRGVYYFRISKKYFKADIVRHIVSLGHEAGYHYDDLTQCKGNYDLAIKRFEKNLNMLREIAPVKTICMDGSPLSRYDNRNLWRQSDSETESLRDGSKEYGVGSKESGGKSKEKGASEMHDLMKVIENKNFNAHHLSLTSSYHYRDFGIIGEPYFDIDFSEVLYLTDTGRMWDGGKVSVRDKVGSREYGIDSKKRLSSKDEEIEGLREGEMGRVSEGATGRKGDRARERRGEGPRYHSTRDIIRALEQGSFPERAMITFHPQRWHDRWWPWFKELVWQNVKNQVKRVLVRDER